MSPSKLKDSDKYLKVTASKRQHFKWTRASKLEGLSLSAWVRKELDAAAKGESYNQLQPKKRGHGRGLKSRSWILRRW